MGKRGPRRLPESIRAARGTLRRDRSNPEKPVGTPGAPEMPHGLDATERRMWATVTANLGSLGLLTEQHGLAVELLVCAAVRYHRARSAMRTHGAVDLEGKRTGAARELDAAHTALLRAVQEFGLSPSAATSVRAAKPTADDAAERRRNRFRALGAGGGEA